MNIDVVILAGGIGSRLATVWNKPKCLVPIGGKAIILHLLDRATRLRPRRIALALGHGADDVCDTIDKDRLHAKDVLRTALHVSRDRYEGTAAALRWAIITGDLEEPILVLNGDTLPGYALADLVTHHELLPHVEGTVAWCNGRHAGAAVINERFSEALFSPPQVSDLSGLLVGLPRFYVPAFLDIGTPADFFRVTKLKEFP